MSKFKIGIELEIGLYPNKGERKLIYKILKSKDLIDKRAKPHINRLRKLLSEAVLENLFEDTVVTEDGNAEEFIFPPRFPGYYVSNEIFKNNLEKIPQYGYYDKIPNTSLGVHHTVEKSVFKSLESFKRFLDIIYTHREVIYRFAVRIGITDTRADIRHLLGDIQQQHSKEELQKLYENIKRILIEGFIDPTNVEVNAFGLRINANEKPLVEIKYYSSTLKYNEFRDQIILTEGLIRFANENMPINEFKNYLHEHFCSYGID